MRQATESEVNRILSCADKVVRDMAARYGGMDNMLKEAEKSLDELANEHKQN